MNINYKERNEQIKKRYVELKRLAPVGKEFGISRERVRQIVRRIKYKRITPIIMSKRITCFICRKILSGIRKKYCNRCCIENKLVKGRDLVRGMIRGRDNNTCQSCGLRWRLGMDKKRLDIHHMGGDCGKKSRKYDSITDDLSKLITVCHKCHYNLHDHSMQNTIHSIVI